MFFFGRGGIGVEEVLEVGLAVFWGMCRYWRVGLGLALNHIRNIRSYKMCRDFIGGLGKPQPLKLKLSLPLKLSLSLPLKSPQSTQSHRD